MKKTVLINSLVLIGLQTAIGSVSHMGDYRCERIDAYGKTEDGRPYSGAKEFEFRLNYWNESGLLDRVNPFHRENYTQGIFYANSSYFIREITLETGRAPVEITIDGQLRPLYRTSLSTTYVSVEHYFSTCMAQANPCSTGYFIYAEGGLAQGGGNGYGLGAFYRCTKIE
jgi:hypothetical protein